MPSPPKHRARHAVPDGRQRIRALRALLDLPTPAALASFLNIEGLGPDTIKDIETRGRPRQLWDYEAVAIAELAGVHPTFFTAPLAQLGDVDARGG